MEQRNSSQDTEAIMSLKIGDKVQSRLPTDRFRRTGQILDIISNGVVVVKWDLLDNHERMRAQALIKQE